MFLGGQINLKQKKKKEATRKKGGITKHWDQSELNQACAKGGLSKEGTQGSRQLLMLVGIFLWEADNDTITRNLYLHTKILIALVFFILKFA